MRSVTYLDDIFVGEYDIVSFDFSVIASSNMQVSNPAVTCAALANDDINPAAMLVGLPVIVGGGLKVEQQVAGTVKGVSYLLLCTATIDGMPKTAAGVLRVI